MSEITRERLFGFRHAFDDRVTLVLTLTALILFLLAPLLIFVVTRAADSTSDKRKELWDRYRSWIWLALFILIPILAGAFWTILAVVTLSFLCYREYARITGLFRERTISLIVVIGNLGNMANDWNYRPILLLIIFAVELNDIFAYICGHLFGHRKFVPNTSPNKTVGGALGAIALTTPLFAFGAHFIWLSTALDTPVRLVGLGIIVSIVGQFGDLMLSSIKRDLGLKDTAKLIPGHGGILDRFDSLILVAPAVFHYVNYFVGFAVNQPLQIFSG